MSRTISIFIAILCGINLYGDKYIAAFEPRAIYGYRQTIVLEALEAEVGKKASEIFDFMVGTSTGAVIAALASSQNDESKSGYSAAEIRHMYEVVGRSLFSESKPFTMGEFFASRG